MLSFTGARHQPRQHASKIHGHCKQQWKNPQCKHKIFEEREQWLTFFVLGQSTAVQWETGGKIQKQWFRGPSP